MLSKLGFLKERTPSVRKRGEQPQENEREMVLFPKPITGVSATDGVVSSFLPKRDRLNLRCVSRTVQQGIDYWNPIRINSIFRTRRIGNKIFILHCIKNRLLVFNESRLQSIFDTETGSRLAIIANQDKYLTGHTCLSIEGDKLILRTRNKVVILNANTGECYPRIQMIWGTWDMNPLQDGKLAICRKNSVQIWDTNTAKRLITFKPDESFEPVIRLLPLQNGKVATCGLDLVQIWDLTTGECLVKFQNPDMDTYISGAFLLKDGKLAICGYHFMCVLNLSMGERIVTCNTDYNYNKVEFLKNDKLMTCRENLVQIWDMETGECLSSTLRAP